MDLKELVEDVAIVAREYVENRELKGPPKQQTMIFFFWYVENNTVSFSEEDSHTKIFAISLYDYCQDYEICNIALASNIGKRAFIFK